MRGDVVIVDFRPTNPAAKVRPALVIQNDRDNTRHDPKQTNCCSSTSFVAPMSRRRNRTLAASRSRCRSCEPSPPPPCLPRWKYVCKPENATRGRKRHRPARPGGAVFCPNGRWPRSSKRVAHCSTIGETPRSPGEIGRGGRRSSIRIWLANIAPPWRARRWRGDFGYHCACRREGLLMKQKFTTQAVTECPSAPHQRKQHQAHQRSAQNDDRLRQLLELEQQAQRDQQHDQLGDFRRPAVRRRSCGGRARPPRRRWPRPPRR